MRILYFSRDYTTHDHRFLSALAKSEHKIFYLQLERRGHVLEDRALPPQIEQVTWEGGQRPVTFKDGFSLLKSLRRVIHWVKPDLVQAGPLQTAAFLTALTGFKPLLSMSWGYDLLVDVNRGPAWRWATRYTLRHSQAMLGDCETIRQLAVSYGMQPERIVTFPWGVDLQHFQPPSAAEIKSRTEHAELVLLSTRGWEPIYGVDILARAFVKAAQKLASQGGPVLRLLMLGGGSQAGLLRQIFSQGGVTEQVNFLGQVGFKDLPRCFRSADLYVSASHSDGSSISLLEAMASGLPALVSDIPGNREWVTPGEQGWWFPDGDANALADAIVRAAEQRDQLSGMGQAARSVAEARADWKKNFPLLLDAYKKLGV